MTVPGGKVTKVSILLFDAHCPVYVSGICERTPMCRRRSRSKTDGRESLVDERVRYSNATTRAQGLDPM